jgi:hypothetical protein
MLEFEGPRGRYYRALYELDNPTVKPVNDVWVIKLKRMLQQRNEYDPIRYQEEQPVFHTLLSIYEDDSTRSPKHMLEAMLVTGEDFNKIAERLGEPSIKDGLMVGLYHELFYNIRPHLKSVPMMYKYVVQPLTNCNGTKIPFGEIWKLLAYCGGMDVLEASGFGTRPLNPEDLAYLVQLGGYRNAALMLKYITDGDDFIKDNPIASNIILGLTELTQKTSQDVRDRFGFKQVEEVRGEDFSHALTGIFKMVYETNQIADNNLTIEDKLITCQPTKIEA